MTFDRVKVHHEWGVLKEAIVGIGETMIIPRWSEEYEYLADQSQSFVRTHQEQRLADADPEGFALMLEQLESFVDILQRRGVTVHRPRPASKSELNYLSEIGRGICQLFPRDPVLVIGDTVIETALREPVRRRERFSIRDALAPNLEKRDYRYVSMPEPEPPKSATDYGPGPFLEGGDVVLNGYEIYVGLSGHASNRAGLNWLRRFLGGQYRVTPIGINPALEHLDCVLSLPKPGLAVICREAIVGDLPDSLRGWDVIEVSIEEAKALAANGLILDKNTYICGDNQPRLAEALTKHGLEVITVAFDAVTRWSGGMRCAHHPLVRESDLDSELHE
jgi:glycine amidinotransferase